MEFDLDHFCFAICYLFGGTRSWCLVLFSSFILLHFSTLLSFLFLFSYTSCSLLLRCSVRVKHTCTGWRLGRLLTYF
ncbi:hypothetical protein BDV06DRAFT_205699 [Aspergillus oleicola]